MAYKTCYSIKKMAKIRGYYINLKSADKRNQLLTANLKSLDKEKNYTRFEAIKISSSPKSLRTGEYGLWLSWSSLLKQIEKEPNKEYDYIHIIEDDVILSSEFFKFIDIIDGREAVADIIMTDMYTNISIYNVYSNIISEIVNNNNNIPIKTIEEYTGCLSSCLIHRSKISKIRKIVDAAIEKEHLLPIDNYLRKLSKSGKIHIITTIPFLTSVRYEFIKNSTIQERRGNISNEEALIADTQIYNTHLRRLLSVFRKREDMNAMMSTVIKLIEHRKHNTDMLKIELVEKINSLITDQNILRYRRETRLDGEDNPQAKKNS